MPGRVEIVSFASRILKENPPGDPVERGFPVYLPPGYDTAPSRQYPVVFVLSGFSGTAMAVENSSGWGEKLSQRMDRLIESGACPPAILVSPDCFTRLGGSQYLNSSALGNYEDYLIQEVVPFIDAEFRTLSGPGSRGVIGKSSGGYGALVHLMKHPEIFGGAACHAGDMGFEYCYQPDFPKVVSALSSPDPRPYVDKFLAEQKKPGSAFAVMNILCMAACYSPNSDSPWGFDLPFDHYTGQIIQEVWARWLDKDPVRMVTRYSAALQGAKLLFIDCGSRDNFNLFLGARQLVSVLSEMGVTHVYEEYPDDHFGLTYRYDRSLPLLVEALISDQAL